MIIKLFDTPYDMYNAKYYSSHFSVVWSTTDHWFQLNCLTQKRCFQLYLIKCYTADKQLNTILPLQDVDNVKTWLLLNSQLLEHYQMIKVFIKVAFNPKVKVFI